MCSVEIPEELIQEVNAELSKEGIDHRRRPWEALGRIASRLRTSIQIPSEEATAVFDWYEKHGKPGSQKSGGLYSAAYFYDSEFWEVSVPVIYGEVSVNALDSLVDMPQPLMEQIMSTSDSAWDYVAFWCDCFDFGFGYDDLYRSKSHSEFGIQFLHAGHEELTTAASLLLENPPNKRAIMSCRMALEMLMKAYIDLKRGLTESDARTFGHDLEALFEEFVKLTGEQKLIQLKPLLTIFPPVSDRYKAQTASKSDLFQAFSFAQMVGAELARELTDRNVQKQIMENSHPQ